MNLLTVSGTAILIDPKLKRDHDTVNGIINGYCCLVEVSGSWFGVSGWSN